MGLAHLLTVLLGEVTDALADAVLIWGEVVLAGVDLLAHLMAPVEGVRVAGDGGLCSNTAPGREGDGGRCDGHLGLGDCCEGVDHGAPSS
jgi:hypothetical protein